MSHEIDEDNNTYTLKEKIKKIIKDPLKYYGFSFLIFSGLTLIFYFSISPVPLRAGAFMIAVFMGIMCWNQIKFEMRMNNDR